MIKPKNYLLASVNFFLGCTAGYHISRIISYRIRNGDNAGDVVRYIFNGENSVKQPSTAAVSSDSKKVVLHSGNANEYKH